MGVSNSRQIITAALLISLISPLLIGCLQPSPTIVKIGLVAPFEGRFREIGVDVIPAARLAVREWADQHPDAPVIIELVAYDDAGNPQQARSEAEKLAADPAVQIVIGHWREDTTEAALPVYEGADLPLITFHVGDLSTELKLYNLAPAVESLTQTVSASGGEFLASEDVLEAATTQASDQVGGTIMGLSQFYSLTDQSNHSSRFVSWAAMPLHMADWSADQAEQFTAGFVEGSLGASPGFFSAAAYEATWLALDILAENYDLENINSPAADFEFEANRRVNAPIYFYQWQSGERMLLEALPIN